MRVGQGTVPCPAVLSLSAINGTRNRPLSHFEIVPAYEMPLEAFQELLNQIVVSGPY